MKLLKNDDVVIDKGNGKSAKPVLEIAQVKKEEVKAEAKAEPKTEVKKELTLNEKIEKVNNLNLIIEKREKLNESKKKLQKFVIGSDSLTTSVYLKDGNGNEFRTNQTLAVKKIIEFLTAEVNQAVSETEKQINF
jgi:hypothetical protein